MIKWPKVMSVYPNPKKLRELSLKDGLSVADTQMQEAMVKSAQIKMEASISNAEASGMLDITSYGQAWISDNVIYLADKLLHKPTTEIVKAFIGFPSKLRISDLTISTDDYLANLHKYRAQGIKYVPSKDEDGNVVLLSHDQVKINEFVTQVAHARNRSLTVAFIVLSEVLSGVMGSEVGDEGAVVGEALATNVAGHIIRNVLQQLLVLKGPELKRYVEVPSVARIMRGDGLCRKDGKPSVLGEKVLGVLGIQSLASLGNTNALIEGRTLLEHTANLLCDVTLEEGVLGLSAECTAKMDETRFRTVSGSCEARPVLERPISDGLYNSYKSAPLRDYLLGGSLNLDGRGVSEIDRKAIDRIQGTPFRVNRQLLEVMENAVRSGLFIKDKLCLDEAVFEVEALADFPVRGTLTLLEHSEAKRNWFAVTGNKERYEEWCRIRDESRGARAKAVSVNDMNLRTLEIARWYADWGGVFYLPVFLDYRTRMYYMPTLFNPQSSKMAKALFVAGKGKVLGTEEALEAWLVNWGNTHKVIGAFAGDKAPLSLAVSYCRSRLSEGARIATDPLAFANEWTGQDDPFAFLAHCFECKDILEHGLQASSSIFVSMDGSCNAYQHASGYLLDQATANRVNLCAISRDLPPADMYGSVATKYASNAVTSSSEYDRIIKYHDLINRSSCKRITMCLGYGLTMAGALNYGRAEIAPYISHFASIGKGSKVLEGASTAFSEGVWSAVEQVAPAIIRVKSALQIMGTLACRFSSSNDGSISWTTSNGTVVKYIKYKSKVTRIDRTIGNKRVQFKVNTWLDSVDDVEMSNCTAPNKTHQMDAEHMRNAINMMPEGCSYLVVHDSFGTLASDAPKFRECIKKTFRAMYEGKHHLMDMFNSLMVGALEYVGCEGKLESLESRLEELKALKAEGADKRSVCRKLIEVLHNINQTGDLDWDEAYKSVYDFR